MGPTRGILPLAQEHDVLPLSHPPSGTQDAPQLQRTNSCRKKSRRMASGQHLRYTLEPEESPASGAAAPSSPSQLHKRSESMNAGRSPTFPSHTQRPVSGPLAGRIGQSRACIATGWRARVGHQELLYPSKMSIEMPVRPDTPRSGVGTIPRLVSAGFISVAS